MIRGITALAMACALILSGIAWAADGDATIKGLVTNSGTDGGGSVTGLEVTLNRYLGDSLDDSRQVVIGEDGWYALDGVSTRPTYIYQASLVYQDAGYCSDFTFFDQSEADVVADVVVYDTTTSDETIRISKWHIIAQVEGGELYVLDVYNDRASAAGRT